MSGVRSLDRRWGMRCFMRALGVSAAAASRGTNILAGIASRGSSKGVSALPNAAKNRQLRVRAPFASGPRLMRMFEPGASSLR